MASTVVSSLKARILVYQLSRLSDQPRWRQCVGTSYNDRPRFRDFGVSRLPQSILTTVPEGKADIAGVETLRFSERYSPIENEMTEERLYAFRPQNHIECTKMRCSPADYLVTLVAATSLLLQLAVGPSTRFLFKPSHGTAGRTFESRLALGCSAYDLALSRYDLEHIRGISSIRAQRLAPVLEKHRSASPPDLFKMVAAIKGFGPVTTRMVLAALTGSTPGNLVSCPTVAYQELSEK